jgi:hypothetical protein
LTSFNIVANSKLVPFEAQQQNADSSIGSSKAIASRSSIGVVSGMSRPAPVSVVETPEFLAATRRIMDDDERGLLVDYLARNPTAGDLIPGAGGVRKLRWALEDAASEAARGWSITTTVTQFRSSP